MRRYLEAVAGVFALGGWLVALTFLPELYAVVHP
ncbi:hypothetical protein MMUC44124_26640 [Mycolicibacterium mucogenicum DSM 44124]|nr:hypothetical protein MMUC44124_26640 [Mycolicibacterium mucogenicum DSM 44124]